MLSHVAGYLPVTSKVSADDNIFGEIISVSLNFYEENNKINVVFIKLLKNKRNYTCFKIFVILLNLPHAATDFFIPIKIVLIVSIQ